MFLVESSLACISGDEDLIHEGLDCGSTGRSHHAAAKLSFQPDSRLNQAVRSTPDYQEVLVPWLSWLAKPTQSSLQSVS